MQLKVYNAAIEISFLFMIGLIEVKFGMFLCILRMSGNNKQLFVKPYTVKFKILVNKYYRMIEYICEVQL